MYYFWGNVGARFYFTRYSYHRNMGERFGNGAHRFGATRLKKKGGGGRLVRRLFFSVCDLSGATRCRSGAPLTTFPHTQQNRYFTEMCSGSVAGSYLRLIGFVSFNSRLESNKEEAEGGVSFFDLSGAAWRTSHDISEDITTTVES